MMFWSPAFKINPALFLRWCRQMTVFQPDGGESHKLPLEFIYPVTLPLEQAGGGLTITLASVMADKRKIPALLPKIRTSLVESLLVYHPFVKTLNELIHPVMKVSIDPSALKYGVAL